MENIKISTSALILIAGAVIGILSLFLVWASVMNAAGYTGIDIMTKESFNEMSDSWRKWMPLLTVILTIIAAIVAMLPTFGVQMDDKICYGILIGIGVIALIFMVLYATWGESLGSGAPEYIKSALGGAAGIGCKITWVVAALPAIIGGLGITGALED